MKGGGKGRREEGVKEGELERRGGEGREREGRSVKGRSEKGRTERGKSRWGRGEGEWPTSFHSPVQNIL